MAPLNNSILTNNGDDLTDLTNERCSRSDSRNESRNENRNGNGNENRTRTRTSVTFPVPTADRINTGTGSTIRLDQLDPTITSSSSTRCTFVTNSINSSSTTTMVTDNSNNHNKNHNNNINTNTNDDDDSNSTQRSTRSVWSCSPSTISMQSTTSGNNYINHKNTNNTTTSALTNNTPLPSSSSSRVQLLRKSRSALSYFTSSFRRNQRKDHHHCTSSSSKPRPKQQQQRNNISTDDEHYNNEYNNNNNNNNNYNNECVIQKNNNKEIKIYHSKQPYRNGDSIKPSETVLVRAKSLLSGDFTIIGSSQPTSSTSLSLPEVVQHFDRNNNNNNKEEEEEDEEDDDDDDAHCNDDDHLDNTHSAISACHRPSTFPHVLEYPITLKPSMMKNKNKSNTESNSTTITPTNHTTTTTIDTPTQQRKIYNWQQDQGHEQEQEQEHEVVVPIEHSHEQYDELEPDMYGQIHVIETPELIESAQVQMEFILFHHDNHNGTLTPAIPTTKRTSTPSTSLYRKRICTTGTIASSLPSSSSSSNQQSPHFNIPLEQIEAVHRACRECPSIANRDFQLIFLRTELFRPICAAKRYAIYWQKRIELFGPERAFQPLTMSSLTVLEIQMIKYQHITIIVPQKNKKQHGPDHEDEQHQKQSSCQSSCQSSSVYTTTTGSTTHTRSIMYVDYGKFYKKEMANIHFTRAMWYLLHRHMEDCIESQKKGMVYIVNSRTASIQKNMPSTDFLKEFFYYFKGCVPVRLSAYHVVYPPTIVRYVYPIVTVLLNPRLKSRIIIHYDSGSNSTGTNKNNNKYDKDKDKDKKVSALVHKFETKYNLSRHDLPIDIGGTNIMDINKWIQEQLVAGK